MYLSFAKPNSSWKDWIKYYIFIRWSWTEFFFIVCWKEFSAVSPALFHRDLEILKKCWMKYSIHVHQSFGARVICISHPFKFQNQYMVLIFFFFSSSFYNSPERFKAETIIWFVFCGFEEDLKVVFSLPQYSPWMSSAYVSPYDLKYEFHFFFFRSFLFFRCFFFCFHCTSDISQIASRFCWTLFSTLMWSVEWVKNW